MRTTNVETLKINYLSREQYEAACAAGTISDTELYFIPEERISMDNVATKDELSAKANKIQTVTAIMLAANWADNKYSFEVNYPFATYDVDVMIDGDNATLEQFEAFNAAMMVSSAVSNSTKAFGDVPTIDIPVILKVQVK